MVQVNCLVEDFFNLVLGVLLDLSSVNVHKGLGVTQALVEECLELVLCNRVKSICVMPLHVLLLAEADPVPEEWRCKENPSRPRSSSNSKIVLTLLTEFVAVHVRLSAVYVWRRDLQLLPRCLGNNGSWSGSVSGSRRENESKSGDLSLQNSLKNPLQVILGVLGNTSSSSKGVSNKRFCPQKFCELVRQFITQLRR